MAGMSGPRAVSSPLYRIGVLAATALSVGSAASLAAIGFVEAVAWLNDTLLIAPRARVQFAGGPGLLALATLAVPTAGGLIVGLAFTRLSRLGRQVGPPDVIGAIQLGSAPPGPREGAISTAAAAVSLGFGASVGQYGPMVLLGAVIGALAARLRLDVPNLSAIAMACGVAAAIATAFNAPIAGLVFAHEVVLRHYATQAFAPTTLAAAVGYVISNVVFGRPALFLVDFAGVAHGHEFLLFALLGVICAGVAIGFMRLILALGAWRGRLRVPRALHPAGAGLAVGAAALWLPDILGTGREALRFATIEGAYGALELPMIILAKIALTALCIAMGFAGGVFSPALLIGVLIGAWAWMMGPALAGLPNSGIAVYAICGMMALAGPVTGAPLTMILIVFELTRNYDLTIAAMVAVVVSNLLAHRLFGRSLFDRQLAGRGVDLSAGRDRARLAARAVRDVAGTGPGIARADETAGEVQARLAAEGLATAFVTDAEGRFAGQCSPGRAPPARPVGEVAEPPALTFDEATTLAGALEALSGFVGEAVAVVRRDDGVLLGLVTEADIIAAQLEVTDHMRREEHAVL